jgi:DNA repair protein RadC
VPPCRRWRIRGCQDVKAYVESLADELSEWLLALFVDSEMNLLAVDTIGRGDVSSVNIKTGRILCRGHALGAAAFILVHNHPSGDPRPSSDDIRFTRRLASAAAEFEMPLLNHLIIAGDGMRSVGHF